MSWNLKGSYFETCSCDLMCPCNLSFDHGATYDYCRVTLVFHIREGEIEGTDVSGLQARRDRGHAEGHDRGQLAARHVRRRGRDRRAGGEAQRGLRRADGRPDGGFAPLVGEVLGVERAPIEVVEDGLRHSVRIGDAIDFEVEDIVPFGVETGRAGALRRHVPPGCVEPHDGGGEAVEDQRLRHRVRGEVGAVDLRVLVGRLSS